MSNQTKEKWKPVVGFEGFYMVSDKGNVKRIAGPAGKRINRMLKPFDSRGYPLVRLCISGVESDRYIHRLVLRAFVGPAPSGHETNHKNGIRDDNALGNLEWVTRSENCKHRCNVLGSKPTGPRKLAAEDVLAIRRLKTPHNTEKLAGQFGVHWSTIYSIVNRNTWKHLAEEVA